MKELKELKLEELSVEQKLGLAHVIYICGWSHNAEKDAFVVNLIKNHSLGGVWINPAAPDAREIMKMVKDAADYPILIFTDADSGINEYLIGQHNAIGRTDSELHAYTFGKVVGVEAAKMGFNVVCNPVIDINTTGNARSFGSDKKKIAKLGAAVACGMHDAGILTVGKHYPSGINSTGIDTHMAESLSVQTKEELIDYSLYAYRELIKEDLLDGVMVGHIKCEKIDPDNPASLSKPVIDIIRELGFDGFVITDALGMMGIQAKYGFGDSHGLAIAAGADLTLPFLKRDKESYEAILSCYEKGIISDERIDAVARRVLAAQHKTLMTAKYTEITEADKEIFESINYDCISAKCDDGVLPSISRDGKHYFAVMVRNEEKIGGDGGVAVDTFSTGWLYPNEVIEKIKELFPNSKVRAIHQFPSQQQIHALFHNSLDCEDVVFLTFTESLAYTGEEHLTKRIEMLFKALQVTNKVSTVIHFGNPKVLETLPHVSRFILGCASKDCVNGCLEVLAGEREPKGKLTYDVDFK